MVVVVEFATLNGRLPRRRRWFCLFCAAFIIVSLVTCWSISATAQTGSEDVHITPLKPAKKEGRLREKDARSRVRPIIVKDVNVVLVPVTVTDDMGRPVTGLEKNNFAVFEGKARQQLQYFSSEDAPVSVGILFDSSGSMSDKIDAAREAVAEIFKTANPQDEFFLISFSDRPELISDFDRSPEDIQTKLLSVMPNGQTALFDAIYLGLNMISRAHNPRRALLIISDGGDNHSRYTEREVKATVMETDTPIYAVGIHTAPRTREEHLGFRLLDEMAEATGGRHFSVESPQDLADAATKIGYALRDQYVLGYRADAQPDGKWHKIRVRLEPPKGMPRLRVYAKTGYYAPAR